MDQALSLNDKIKRGAEDSGRYFKYMADFVGFTEEDAQAIKESRFVIEKYIPSIVSAFYTNLLRYPNTRKFFLKPDGSIDQEYLQLRMHHLQNFWRRTTTAVFDEDYARYVDYVGRAHTQHGADPNIYIPDRYVIGQVGYIQHAISEALTKELHEIDPDWEVRAQKAWNKLMILILELLSRAYGNEREPETYRKSARVEKDPVLNLAVEAYELGLGMRTSLVRKDFVVAKADEIPEGERKVLELEGLSVGIFHHKGRWYALRNSCLHRGGPVCTGNLDGEIITCPWHGYQYNITNGQLTTDPSASLAMYPVEVQGGEIHVEIPQVTRDEIQLVITEEAEETKMAESTKLKENEFRISELAPGKIKALEVNDEMVAVYNVDGKFYATQEACTHAEGPLSEGWLQGSVVTCPWHDSCFDVITGEVRCAPATDPLKTYRVIIDGEIGRVEE
jgi:nitrite reductase (NADH) small subunit